jgi:hypothetical protein
VLQTTAGKMIFGRYIEAAVAAQATAPQPQPQPQAPAVDRLKTSPMSN